MFLKYFELWRLGELVRRVDFRRGLNAIVDTSSRSRTDSGNNVGKTSFLRSIDYCLGGAAEPLFEDPEFKGSVNSQVLESLAAGSRFVLALEGRGGRTVSLSREYDGQMLIDDEEYSSIAAYRNEIGRLLFGLTGKKPSFRQLIPKFVRIEDRSLQNVVHYLHQATRLAEYDAIYLFLFGFADQQVLSQRAVLRRRVKAIERQHKALKARAGAALRQVVAVIDRDIAELDAQIRAFAIGPEHSRRLENLGVVRREIAALSLAQSRVQIRLAAARDTVREFERARVRIDLETLQVLYAQVVDLHPSIERSFADLVEFHNRMVVNKARFVSSTVSGLEEEERAIDQRLEKLLVVEREVLAELGSEGLFTDLLAAQRRLEELREQRGRKAGLLEEVESISVELDSATKELNDLEATIVSEMDSLQERLTTFNLSFSLYSRMLYGESYVFDLATSTSSTRMLIPSVQSVEANEGTGMKRAKIIAFDLAYLQFCIGARLRAPRFVVHDQLEVVDTNQLATLFELAEGLDGQFVVAALRDRIEAVEGDWLASSVILQLSQEDRFFRL